MRIKPKEIIRLFKKSGSVALVSSTLNIHRATVYRWLRRARPLYGDYLKENIERDSTRPKKINYQVTSPDLVAIIRLRKQRGYGALKLKAALRLPYAVSTIHRCLQRQGLINRYGYHRRPRLQPTIHMHAKNVTTIGYLQMDVKYLTPELTGLPWTCFEYAIIDIFSRYKEAVILNQIDQDGAMAALWEILPKLPFKPVFIQTDNGLEFQERFDKACKDLDLKHHYIHKQSPNENAIIERSFRTDEEEFIYFLDRPLKHYDDLRERFAQYLHFYNTERLHLGINLKTPMEVVANVVIH